MPFYKLRDKNIVSEIIDEEAIIMDLATGTYFSSDAVGAVIWDGMVCGLDDHQVKQRVLQTFAADAHALEADFDSFVASLVANNLVTVVDETVVPTIASDIALPADRRDYVPPILNSYSDLQDLALLDPIHDVEETGWPNRKAEPEEAAWQSPKADAKETGWPNRKTGF